MAYGIQANDTDFEIKELMVELSKDCIEIKTLCDYGKIWAKKLSSFNPDRVGSYVKKNNIFMFMKTPQSTWINDNGEKF